MFSYNTCYPKIDNKSTMEDVAVALASVSAQFGCSMEEVTNAFRALSVSLTELQIRTELIEDSIDKLRPDLDAKTEKSNQKIDLEIFDQIVWNQEFLDLCKDNPFLIDLN